MRKANPGAAGSGSSSGSVLYRQSLTPTPRSGARGPADTVHLVKVVAPKKRTFRWLAKH